MKHNISFITSSRADWGLMLPLYNHLKNTQTINLSVIATGSHFSEESGYTLDEIKLDSVTNLHCLPLAQHYDLGTYNMYDAISELFLRLPDLLSKLKTDLIIILGDRYETHAIATVARLEGIKIAHISGGELTMGAFDDVLRHCITKLSDLHFTATEEYKNRVIQLGEPPENVFMVGELALNDLSNFEFNEIAHYEKMFSTSLDSFFLMTLHPETCSPHSALKLSESIVELILDSFPACKLIITSANADPEGDLINSNFLARATKYSDKVFFVKSLGRKNYLSLLRYAKALIGNSSSGIIEAPAFRVPVINIGKRQDGRVQSNIIINSSYQPQEIIGSIKQALSSEFQDMMKKNFYNPYEGSESAKKIADIITSFDIKSLSRFKKFVDQPAGS